MTGDRIRDARIQTTHSSEQVIILNRDRESSG